MAKRRICPRCGSNRAARIIYGLVGSDTVRDDCILGGCNLDENSPSHCCRNCHYEWGGVPAIQKWDIKSFEAWVGGYFGCSYEISTDFLDEKISYSKSEGEHIDPNHIKTMPLTEEKKFLLLQTLDFCDFVDWTDSYVDLDILDGTQWHIEVEMKDGKVISKSGSNRYPGRWKFFCKRLSELAEGKFG